MIGLKHFARLNTLNVIPCRGVTRVQARSLTAQTLVYSDYGVPQDVLDIHTFEIDEKNLKPDEVVIQGLAFPINPADINQIEGVYPSRPPMTQDLGTSAPAAVPGNEGLFKVIATGSNVSEFTEGDWVLPKLPNFGTWRSHALTTQEDIIKINTTKVPDQVKDISVSAGATVSVNPCTAYQMLKSFVELKPGDWFIQNGGNSGVGRAAIQLGKIFGYNSISVVRSRENLEELKQELYDLGATKVITEEESSDRNFSNTIKQWLKDSKAEGSSGELKLALNCVGGKSATDIARKLTHSGHFVTYGGMSKKPITLPTSLFIFKNITCHGYWLTEFTKQNPAAKQENINEILQLIKTGKFKDVPVEENVFKLNGNPGDNLQVAKDALSKAMKGFGGRKQLVVFQ